MFSLYLYAFSVFFFSSSTGGYRYYRVLHYVPQRISYHTGRVFFLLRNGLFISPSIALVRVRFLGATAATSVRRHTRGSQPDPYGSRMGSGHIYIVYTCCTHACLLLQVLRYQIIIIMILGVHSTRTMIRQCFAVDRRSCAAAAMVGKDECGRTGGDGVGRTGSGEGGGKNMWCTGGRGAPRGREKKMR